MKISLKLFLLTTIITLLSFVGFGFFSYQRDFNQFIADMKKDARTLGYSLAMAIENFPENDKLNSVLKFINKINENDNSIKVRWIWLEDQTESRFKPHIDANKIMSAENNHSSFIDSQEIKYLYTYVKVEIQNRLGALELYEDLSSITAQFFQNNVIHLGLMGLILLALNSLIIAIGGYFIFTKRIGLIIKFIDNIDLNKEMPRIVPSGKDEMTKIMIELDNMCIQLYHSRDELLHEKDEKIKLMEQLNHKDRLAVIGQLSSGIAHELGTPLNVISGRGKLIQTGKLSPDEIHENTEIIINQCQHITSLIKNLLNFARRKAIIKNIADIQQVIEQTLMMIKPQADKKSINMIFNRQENNILLNIDKVQIQQVISNLVLNSIHATSNHGCIEINIIPSHIENNKKYIIITIKDNGKGIEETHLKHIFEPFYTTKEIGKGTGLGLSIVYNIIKEHDGYIKVENNIDRGCCFSIYLPYQEDLSA